MKKKCQVYLIDTEQPSIISLQGYQGLGGLLYNKKEYIKSHNYQPKHLYFTSDEEIKEVDWFIYNGKLHKATVNTNKNSAWANTFEPGVYSVQQKYLNKIVATTNPELHKPSMIRRADGCPFYLQSNGLYQATDEHGTETLEVSNINNIAKIGDDFVEAYIKAYNEGKPITEVNLESEDTFNDVANECFADIIPPKEWNLKLRSNGTVIIISPVVEKFYSRNEVLDILMCFDTDSNVGHFNGPTTRVTWFNKHYPQ